MDEFFPAPGPSNTKFDTKRLVGMAMFAALAYAVTFVFRIPVMFLTFDMICSQFTFFKWFNEFITNYYSYSWLEYQILIEIKKVKHDDKIEEICLNMLEELEKIFFKQFNYNEYILSSYEDAISMNDINREVIKNQ